MRPIFIHDKQQLETYLLKYRDMNAYHLGDLDAFFWPYTSWYGLQDEDGGLAALALLYTGADLPVLLAVENDNQKALRELLEGIAHLLPRRVYAHLSPGVETGLQAAYTLDSHGMHAKMTLTQPEKLAAVDVRGAVRLAVDDGPAIQTFFDQAYPGNWFDVRMLETGQYMGIWEAGVLQAVAGIHVYSPAYQIAALGNITTLPERRGQGLGTAVTAALCKQLMHTVDVIGLHVKSDNAVAIGVYERLGFSWTGDYEEFMLISR